MKSILNFINESANYWEMHRHFSYIPSAKYLWMNTEGLVYGFMTDKDIKSLASDFEEDAVDYIYALKPGEMYDADGGINLYFRIK